MNRVKCKKTLNFRKEQDRTSKHPLLLQQTEKQRNHETQLNFYQGVTVCANITCQLDCT